MNTPKDETPIEVLAQTSVLSKDLIDSFMKKHPELIMNLGHVLDLENMIINTFSKQISLARQEGEKAGYEKAKEKYSSKKCRFCNRRYRDKGYLGNHEYQCYKNPNRYCFTCENEGVIDEIMSNGYMGHKNLPCPDCEISKQALKESHHE